MNFQVNAIYSIKIANGDEIVARVSALPDDHTLCVTQPLTVVPSAQGIQLMPSLFTTDLDAEITINISNISMWAPAREQVCDSYTEALTGIKPVRKQFLVD